MFTKLPLYSLDSQNYAEDTEEYRLCQQRITTCLESIRVLQNFTDDYLSTLIEKLAQPYPVYSDEYEQQSYSEIEVIYEEFKLLLNKFGFQFFTQEFVRFSLSASDAPPENGMVNGKLLFLICLRTFICDQERVKDVRYLLDLSKQNIFQLACQLQQNLIRNRSDACNLTVVLGIIRILLEATKSFVNYDFYKENADVFETLVDSVLAPNMQLLTQQDVRDSQILLQNSGLDGSTIKQNAYNYIVEEGILRRCY